MRFFCGWQMGFLPYVATKCSANKKKNPPRIVFLFQVQTDTFFHNGTAAKKATRTSSADFRAHRRCLMILPRHDQGRSNLCVVRLEIPNRSKNEKTKSPLTCKQTKKKRNDNRFPKIVSWGNLKFRSCSQPSWTVHYRRNILRTSGNKNYYSLTLTWVAEDDCKELPSSCSCSWWDDREELSSSTSCRWLVAVAFRSSSDHDRFFGKKPNPLNA